MASVNPMDLAGRSILVTGASSGIGRATALLLSRLGAEVVLVGRDRERLDRVAGELDGKGHAVEPFDLRQLDDTSRWMEQVVSARGRPLHGLVHAAGVHSLRPLSSVSRAAFDEVMTINLGAAAVLAKAFRSRRVNAGGGSIVLVSSVTGLVGQAGVSLYSASKGGLIALARALAVELVRDKIRVNSVCPSLVDSPMTRELFGRLLPAQVETIQKAHLLGVGKPEDVACMIAFLLGDASGWVTGAAFVVDGGYSAQ